MPTTIAQVAVLPPSAVVAVIVALPEPTAVTRPVLETVATLWSELDQRTDLFVASEGLIVAVSWELSPAERLMIAWARLTLDTATAAAVLIAQVANLAPSTVVTVIVAVPPPVHETRPALEMVATLSSELDQTTDLFVALAGYTVTVSCELPPAAKPREELSRLTLDTATAAGIVAAVIAQVANLAPSTVATVIVAAPAPAHETRPPLETRRPRRSSWTRSRSC